MQSKRQRVQRGLLLAQRLGLASPEMEGVQTALLTNAANLTLAQRLQIALDQLPVDHREGAHEFLASLSTVGRAVLQRGSDVLNGMSDEEWDALFSEEPEA